MAFTVKGKEPLDARLNVRLPTSELNIIRDDADLAGMSMSELVRDRYFGRPIIANADIVMIKELRRIGGLLKSVHIESGGAYSKQTADVLSDLGSYINKLSDNAKK